MDHIGAKSLFFLLRDASAAANLILQSRASAKKGLPSGVARRDFPPFYNQPQESPPSARVRLNCKILWPKHSPNVIAPPPKKSTRRRPIRSPRPSPSSRRCLPPSSTRRSRSPSASASIPSNPTRWSAAPARSRMARARRSACSSSPKARRPTAAREAGAEFVGFKDMIEKCQGRLPGFRRGHRHAGRDGRSPQARQGARTARPHAEPEDRHRDRRHRQGGEGSQGRPRRVQARQERQRRRPRRQVFLLRPKRSSRTARAVIEAVVKARPAAAKGRFVENITLAATMSPGLTVDASPFLKS